MNENLGHQWWMDDDDAEGIVCETCGKTGKDSTGGYPSRYQGKVQHPEHVDWDDVDKYGR